MAVYLSKMAATMVGPSSRRITDNSPQINATISRPLAEVSFKIWRREANVIIRLGNPG